MTGYRLFDGVIRYKTEYIPVDSDCILPVETLK